MQQILVMLGGVIFIIATLELSVVLTIGWPILRKKDADKVREVLPRATVCGPYYDLLHIFGAGYIGALGWSLFGSTYYSEGRKIVRIPWWTPLYKEVKAKRAELRKMEGLK
jgi:hypothetical protein